MLDTTYDSKTDRRVLTAADRIPEILERLSRDEQQSFLHCRNLAEVLYRELRAWFRSKPPFTWRLPSTQVDITLVEVELAMSELTAFRSLSKERAFDSALVVLAYHQQRAA